MSSASTHSEYGGTRRIPEPVAHRTVHFVDEDGPVNTPIYDQHALTHEDVIPVRRLSPPKTPRSSSSPDGAWSPPAKAPCGSCRTDRTKK